jgi:hypothetical protein
VILGALALAACGQPPQKAASRVEQPPTASGERGYTPPPELTAVSASPQGALQIVGRAQPGAKVRLASPDGAALFVVADGQGNWRLNIARLAQPRLLGLSMSDHGRVIQAQGYVFLAPDGAAARLRAGGGSERVDPLPTGLAATALDYDTILATTLSGRARAGEMVDLRVDGVERGQSSADREGRFVLSLNQPLTPGPHVFDLSAPSGQAHVAADIAAPAPLSAAPFRAERTPVGWRLDWLTPGGGEQTTFLLGYPPH